jgi:hypothetical protein
MDLAAVGPRTVDNLNPIVENRGRGRVLFDEVLSAAVRRSAPN